MHPYFRATRGDYKGSGYDRGHLAAASNHRYSQKAMDQTFMLSNVSPQVRNILKKKQKLKILEGMLKQSMELRFSVLMAI